MFNNAKSIEINGKVVKSIITKDGGVLYEKIVEEMELFLTYLPSTVYKGDTVNLTATLTGGNVSNKNINLLASEPCMSKHFSTTELSPLDDTICFNGLKIGGEICIKEYSQDIEFHGEYPITIGKNSITKVPASTPITYPIYIEQVEANSYNFYHSPNGEKTLLFTENSNLTFFNDFDALSNFIILSTDNNGVASTDIVCDSFTSLNVTASYNELSDSVNIIVDDKYDLDLSSDKDILSYYNNDSAILTATLSKNNSALSNEQILFYDSDNVNLATYYDWLDVFLLTVTPENQGEIIFDTTNAEHNNFYTEDATSGGGYSNGGRVKFVITDTQVETWRYNSSTDTWTKSMILYNLPVKIGLPYGTEIISNTAKIPFFASATTDSNGEATATYNSMGIGDVNIKSECVERSLVSETYVTDAWKYIQNPTVCTDCNISLPPNASISFRMSKPRIDSTSGGINLVLSDNSHSYFMGNWASDGNNGILIRNTGSSTNLVDHRCSRISANTDYLLGVTYDNGSWTVFKNDEVISFTANYTPTTLSKIEITQGAMKDLIIKPL